MNSIQRKIKKFNSTPFTPSTSFASLMNSKIVGNSLEGNPFERKITDEATKLENAFSEMICPVCNEELTLQTAINPPQVQSLNSEALEKISAEQLWHTENHVKNCLLNESFQCNCKAANDILDQALEDFSDWSTVLKPDSRLDAIKNRVKETLEWVRNLSFDNISVELSDGIQTELENYFNNITTEMNLLQDIDSTSSNDFIIFNHLQQHLTLCMEQLKFKRDQSMKYYQKSQCQHSIEDFELLNKIGNGGFGYVYLAKKRFTYPLRESYGELVQSEVLCAIKVMSKDMIIKSNMEKNILRERLVCAAASRNSPESFLQFYTSFTSPSHVYLVTEYLPGGDCLSLLSSLKRFDEATAQYYIAQVCLAVRHMHRHGVVHRDIKADNVMINQWGHVKVGDFGLVVPFDKYKLVNSTTSTNSTTRSDSKPSTPSQGNLADQQRLSATEFNGILGENEDCLTGRLSLSNNYGSSYEDLVPQQDDTTVISYEKNYSSLSTSVVPKRDWTIDTNEGVDMNSTGQLDDPKSSPNEGEGLLTPLHRNSMKAEQFMEEYNDQAYRPTREIMMKDSTNGSHKNVVEEASSQLKRELLDHMEDDDDQFYAVIPQRSDTKDMHPTSRTNSLRSADISLPSITNEAANNSLTSDSTKSSKEQLKMGSKVMQEAKEELKLYEAKSPIELANRIKDWELSSKTVATARQEGSHCNMLVEEGQSSYLMNEDNNSAIDLQTIATAASNTLLLPWIHLKPNVGEEKFRHRRNSLDSNSTSSTIVFVKPNETKKINSQTCGNYFYATREQIIHSDYDHTVDWWTVAVLLFHFLAGETPFQAATVEETLENIIQLNIKWMVLPEEITTSCRNFMQNILLSEPELRLGYASSQSVLDHEFFQDIDFHDLFSSYGPYYPVSHPEITSTTNVTTTATTTTTTQGMSSTAGYVNIMEDNISSKLKVDESNISNLGERDENQTSSSNMPMVRDIAENDSFWQYGSYYRGDI